MANLPLSLSCGYYDRTIPLLSGLVNPEGIDLIVPRLQPGNTMGAPQADVYELPLPSMIIQQTRKPTHYGLPIFTKRTFFHQAMVMRKDTGIVSLADLRGARIGLMGWYQHTLGVWLRGYLLESLGIRPDELSWFCDRPIPYPLARGSSVSITVIDAEKSLVQRLIDGEIDVLMHEAAHEYVTKFPQLRRVFPDFRAQESAYFAATGCFPPNHVLAIRRGVVDQHPWVVRSLLESFEASKHIVLDTMERNNTVVSTPWLDELLEAQGQVLGPDPYPYGLEETRPSVERVARYLHEQGLIERQVAVAELFCPE